MTPELPFEPGGGGGRGREYFLCRRLVELGHQVLNISPVLPAEAHWAQALRDVGVENWVVERPASHLREAAAAIRDDPSVLVTAVTAPVRALEMRIFWLQLRRLAELAASDWRPDVVVVGHDMAAAWARGLPESLPAVLTLHNLTWHWYRSRARLSRRPAALVLAAEAARYRRYLLELLPRYRAAIAVSTIEAAELRRTVTMPVSVIPTGVDTTTLRPAPEQEGPPRLVFTGTLGYPPNSQGIRWFADYVWPEVRRHVPGVQLDVVGRDPPPSVSELGQREGINVIGPVPVMDPYFARAHAVVVPILTGAGIRVKIVEAMAAGRAVVSTSLGWEGLPYVQPDRDLLVADDPHEFAMAAVRLLTDPELRHRLAGDARLLAEQHYDWRGLGDEQEAVLRDVLARSTRRVSLGPVARSEPRVRLSTPMTPAPPVDQLLSDPPALHGSTTHALVRASLEWIDHLPRPLRTLETGCGLSTLVFALRGDEHVCITPYGDEPERVRAYCVEQGIDGTGLTFEIERSEVVLPTLEAHPRDLVLLDGSHAFPNVFIDYFYAARLLAVGGTMIVDDIHLWTGKVLRDFLSTEPEWEILEEWEGRTIAFRKVAELQNRDWYEQPYVRNRSTPTHTRARMTLSLLKRRDLGTLLNYARGMVR